LPVRDNGLQTIVRAYPIAILAVLSACAQAAEQIARGAPAEIVASQAILLSDAVSQGGDSARLELHFGKESQLSESQQTALRSTALRLLESSNFNSEHHRDILKRTPRQIHAAYRKTLTGRYLAVSFEMPQRIRTIGGDIVVLEIVVGLNRPDRADSLFTIDTEGRVVQHGKYSGGLCIELLNEVLKVRPDA